MDEVTAVEGELKNLSTKSIIVVPDGGFGWIVIISSFFVHVLVIGQYYSFGVFFPTYKAYFQANDPAVSWIGSISCCMMMSFAGFSGNWADRFGNNMVVWAGGFLISAGLFLGSYSTQLWHLYLTQGFITGVGYSLAWIAGVGVVTQWFAKRRGLAVGIAGSGAGLGQFAMNQVTVTFITRLGWRSALRYLALIIFVGLLVCGLGIKRLLPLVDQSEPDSSLQYFRNKSFVFLYSAVFVVSLGYFMPFTYIPRYAIVHGISYSNGVWLLSIVGITTACGRTLMGYISDTFGKILILRLNIFGSGVSVICWTACTTFTTMIVFSVVFGFFASGIITLIPPVTGALFGIDRLSSVIGIVFTAMAAGTLLSAPIGGFLFDVYGTYTPSILFAGFIQLLSAFLLLFVSEPPKLNETGSDASPSMLDTPDVDEEAVANVAEPPTVSGGQYAKVENSANE